MTTKKQQERIERAERRAERLAGAADAAADRARGHIAQIPLGQPILVSHHSEARHRRDLEKHDRAMRKGIALGKAARQAEWSAANAGTAITADDPEALEALEDEIEDLEWLRGLAKTINKEFRRDPDAGRQLVAESSGRLRRDGEAGLRHHGVPFPSYWFSNLGANIRRLKSRYETIMAEKNRTDSEPIEGDGFRIEEDKESMRIRIFFDGKPGAEMRKTLKSSGWRWAPSVGAWQRLLNENGRRSAQRIVDVL